MITAIKHARSSILNEIIFNLSLAVCMPVSFLPRANFYKLYHFIVSLFL